MNDDNFVTTIGSSNQRRATKYSVLAAFVLGTACVMYGGSSTKQESVTSLIDTDIQMSLIEFPDLALQDFDVEEGLNLGGFKKINKEKILKAINRLWDRLDRRGNGYIEKNKVKKACKKVLTALRKRSAFDDAKFE